MPRPTKVRKPFRGEKLGFWWRLTWLALYAPAGALVKLRYRNLDRLPATGPAILVVNHVSHVDPLLVARLVLDGGRVPRVLAKASIFRVKVVGTAMRGMGHVPVERGTADARQSLSAAVAALDNGRVIVLHPEGTVTRDPDWWPMAAKSGAARLALDAPDAPVIPIAQWGVQNAVDLYRKKVRLLPRVTHTMSVGEPIDLSKFRDAPNNNETLREVTDVIMRRLRDDVAELRGVPAPTGDFYRWTRPRKAAR